MKVWVAAPVIIRSGIRNRALTPANPTHVPRISTQTWAIYLTVGLSQSSILSPLLGGYPWGQRGCLHNHACKEGSGNAMLCSAGCAFHTTQVSTWRGEMGRICFRTFTCSSCNNSNNDKNSQFRGEPSDPQQCLLQKRDHKTAEPSLKL